MIYLSSSVDSSYWQEDVCLNEKMTRKCMFKWKDDIPTLKEYDEVMKLIVHETMKHKDDKEACYRGGVLKYIIGDTIKNRT